MALSIAIANHKGGVGKTTCSVNIAYEFSLRHKVLLIDADPQGNTTTHLGFKKNEVYPSLFHVLSGEEQIQKSILSYSDNLDLVPGQPLMHFASVESHLVLSELIKPLKKKYDYIIFDCAPSMSLLSINCLVAADVLITPIESAFLSLDGLNDLTNTISELQKHYRIGIKFLGIVPNMVDWRNKLTHEVFVELSKHFPKQVFKNSIPRNVRLAEAPSHGLPISLYDPNCAGAIAFKKLAAEVKRKAHKEMTKKVQVH